MLGRTSVQIRHCYQHRRRTLYLISRRNSVKAHQMMECFYRVFLCLFRATVCLWLAGRCCNVRQCAARKKHAVAACDSLPQKKNILSQAATTPRWRKTRFRTLRQRPADCRHAFARFFGITIHRDSQLFTNS